MRKSCLFRGVPSEGRQTKLARSRPCNVETSKLRYACPLPVLYWKRRSVDRYCCSTSASALKALLERAAKKRVVTGVCGAREDRLARLKAAALRWNESLATSIRRDIAGWLVLVSGPGGLSRYDSVPRNRCIFQAPP